MTLRRYELSKFDLEIDAYLYEVSLNGGADEEIGDSTEGAGWYGLMRAPLVDEERVKEYGLTDEEVSFLKSKAGAIIFEDTTGLVTVEYFDNPHELEAVWDEIVHDPMFADEDE